MKLNDFRLERYFARFEFNCRYLLSSSDSESFTVSELLVLTGESEKYRAQFDQLPLSYTESKGAPQLRKAISTLYDKTSPDQILVHTGAQEAIYNFMNIFLEPSDSVVVSFPAYQSLYEVAKAHRCKLFFWKDPFDLEDLKKILRKTKVKLLVLNSPHNPTGHHFTPDEWSEILKLCRKHDVFLFSDEVYRFSEHDPKDRLKAACDVYEKAISLGVMSKSFGLPGLRIGWIATQVKKVYDKMAAFKDYTTICNSAPSEFLARLGLEHKDKLIERNLGIILKNKKTLEAFLNRHPKIVATLPRAGVLTLAKFAGSSQKSVGPLYYEKLANYQGLMLLPGECFELDSSYFRIGFGRKNFEECLGIFEKHLPTGV